MDVSKRHARLAALNAEIKSQWTAIRALRSEMNTFVSFSLLPDELLVYIFSLVSPDLMKHKRLTLPDVPGRDRVFPPPWLPASQVCVRWRVVALCASVLNRDIDMDYHPQWTERIIERAMPESGFGFRARLASATPIAVRRFTTLLQQHCNKIEQIEMACGSAQHDVLAKFLIATGAELTSTPKLQRRLADDGGEQPTYTATRFDALTHLDLRRVRDTLYFLPAKLAPLALPNLRHLHIHNIVLGTKFPPDLLRLLTTLDLRYDIAQGSGLSLKTLLALMAHASSVERLVLRLALYGVGAWPDEDLGKLGAITFRSLRVLELEAPSRLLSKLLGVINTPMARIIELKSEAWVREKNLSRLLPSWPGRPEAMFDCEPQPDFESQPASGAAHGGVAARVWDVLCAFRERGTHLSQMSIQNTKATARVHWASANGARLSLIMPYPVEPVTMQHIQAMLPKGALKHAVTSIKISHGPAHPTWFDARRVVQKWGTLPSLDVLVNLSLSHGSGATLLALIASEHKADALPRLRKLCLHGMRYSSLANDLFSWIQHRTELRGREFRELVITGYDRSEDVKIGLGDEDIQGILTALLGMYAERGRQMKYVWDWQVVRKWD